MEFIEKIFPFIFITIFILAFSLILFNIIAMFNPKLRSKMMKNNLKSLNYFMEDSKDEFKSFTNTSKDILDENKDTLKDIANINADINEDAITKTAEAIAKGIKKGK